MQNSGRDEVQDGFFTIDDDRMAGIVPALKTYDGVDAIGQHVDDLAFAFVTPLSADDDD